MGKCLFMRKGETHSAPVNYNPVFSNNDWATIIDACQKNKVPDTWVVGDSKTMSISGYNFTIDIIGKNHDNYADGSGKAPLTFQMHEIINKGYMNTTTASNSLWESTTMRTQTLPSLLTTLPSEVQSAIREVSKATQGNKTSSGKVSQATTEKLFLLSETEVFGGTPTYADGSQYAYYSAGNSKSKKTITSGSNSVWWLRTGTYAGGYMFTAVSANGTSATYGDRSGVPCITFGFCF